MQALSDQSVAVLQGVLPSQGMANRCPSSHLAHGSVLSRWMGSCASGLVSSRRQRQSKPWALSTGPGKHFRHSLWLPFTENQIKKAWRNLEKECVVQLSCSHAKALGQPSFHAEGKCPAAASLDVVGLQCAVIASPDLFVGCLLVFVIFKSWTLRSSSDLLTVLADTSVQSHLWLLLSGKDRQTLAVWHGLDTLEISIFPFSKTKVKRGDDDHVIISLKSYLGWISGLRLFCSSLNHFPSFSLLFERKSRSFRCYRILNWSLLGPREISYVCFSD